MNKKDDIKTDQELVKLTLKDRQAFTHIVNRYEGVLRRYVFRLGCINNQDQDDVLQEIFLKIYVNLNDYDQNLKFSSWAYRIAHNETISFFRKKNSTPKPVVTEEELNLFEELVDDSDILNMYDKKLESGVVQNALSTLGKQYRDVLVLKFIEDKSYNEISDILKIPIGTVGTLVNRGKKQLKQILKNKYE